MRCARIAARTVLLAIGLVVALTSAPAHAGSYAVIGGCGGNWTPANSNAARLAIYEDCPGLMLRHVRGAFHTPYGAWAQWTFLAPPGTAIRSAQLAGVSNASAGWQTLIYTNTGLVLQSCPGAGCPLSFTLFSPSLNVAAIGLRLQCTASSCSNHDPLKAALHLSSSVINLVDWSVPSVAVTGGDLLSGWRRGTGRVTLSASDNVGIKADRLLVDGTPREQRARACSWGARIPCSNGGAALTLDTTRVSDGQHTVSVQAVDAADNVGGVAYPIYVDNTPPASALGLALAGGPTWRATNGFVLSWRNPSQAHAPIVAVRYQLCPVANAPSQSAGCVAGQRSAANVSSVPDLAVPGPGEWRARLWLVDAAGNEDPRTAVESVLRFDNTPPSVIFREQAVEDPARLRVAATDATSGISGVTIEARRRGNDAWTELPTHPSGGDYAAFLDDESLPPGPYDLRARAVDLAGNERMTVSRTNGQPAMLELPVRTAATLRVGRASRQCKKRQRRPMCKTRLLSAPTIKFGRRTTLEGQLVIGNRGSAAPIEVWRQLKMAGAGWERVSSVQTSSNGRFRYKLAPGPAQMLRFRYGGSSTARGATDLVDARVRAASTFEPSRRRVVNGEYITFRGRLRGGLIPPGGKLVELQVFTRRRWRTFAQPRASAKGRWSFQYRFEAVTGRVRFRFRARIRREAAYPFHEGTSRQVEVTVHGI